MLNLNSNAPNDLFTTNIGRDCVPSKLSSTISAWALRGNDDKIFDFITRNYTDRDPNGNICFKECKMKIDSDSDSDSDSNSDSDSHPNVNPPKPKLLIHAICMLLEYSRIKIFDRVMEFYPEISPFCFDNLFIRFAVEKTHRASIQHLLGLGLDPNACNGSLIFLALNNNPEYRAIDALIALKKAGGNLDCLNSQGKTIMQVAMDKSLDRVLRYMLNGFRMSFSVEDEALMKMVLKLLDTSFIQFLLSHGLDINFSQGYIINSAIKDKKEKVLEFCIDSGADLRLIEKKNLLMIMSKFSIETIDKLCLNGLDLTELSFKESIAILKATAFISTEDEARINHLQDIGLDCGTIVSIFMSRIW